ncbi:MAG: DUF3325 domain-containing protein [Verrucomicrobiota bacterium]
MSWLAFALGYAGVTLFAYAMVVHHRAVFGHAPNPRQMRGFRIGGTTLLAAALFATIAALGWQVGLVAWVAMLGISGFVLTQLLSFAPRLALAPAGGLLVTALLVSVFS